MIEGRGAVMGFVEAPGTAVHVTVADALPSVLEHGLRPAAYWVEMAVVLSDDERQKLLERPRAQVHRLLQPDGHSVFVARPTATTATSARDIPHRGRHGGAVPEAGEQLRVPVPFRGHGAADDRYRKLADQLLLRLDTARLLEALGDVVALTEHNTGAIGQVATRRYKGPGQFVRLADWSSGRPREIAVSGAGIPPDVLQDTLVATEHVPGGEPRG